jgi:hypothetical protein
MMSITAVRKAMKMRSGSRLSILNLLPVLSD